MLNYKGPIGVIEDGAAGLPAEADAFRRLFQGHGAVMYVVDMASFRLVDANEAAVAFYGYDRETLLTKRIPDLNITPEPVIRAEIARAVAEGRSYYVFQHRLANGEVRDVEVYANPVEIEGKQYSFSVVHDITERKTAEEKLRHSEKRLAETQRLAQLGTWEFDPATGAIHWSDETFRIAGIAEPRSSLTFEEYAAIVHPEDLPRLEAALEESTTRKQPYELELRHRRPDGTYNHTLTRGKPVLADGEIVGYVGSVLDITERKRAEEERERLIAELKTALDEIKTLRGLIPICSVCKSIRDDKGLWNQVEVYFEEHADVDFTHSLCPHCLTEQYPELYGDDAAQAGRSE